NRKAALQLGNQIARLGDVESTRRHEEDMVGLHHPVLGLDVGPFDDWQQVALNAFARNIRAARCGTTSWSISERLSIPSGAPWGTIMSKTIGDCCVTSISISRSSSWPSSSSALSFSRVRL